MAPPALSLKKAHLGASAIDAQTPVHFLIGFAAGVMGVDPSVAALTFVGAKIVGQSLESNAERALLHRGQGESLGNQLSDVLVNFLGVQYGLHLRTRLLAPAAQQAPIEGIGADYYDPLTHRYEDYMRYPRIL